MFLYHGAKGIVLKIDLDKSRLRTDFGKGFYLSSKLETARNWAIEKPAIGNNVPTVMRYHVKKDIFNPSELNFLRFDAPSEDWLEFVKNNRRKDSSSKTSKEPRHDYDLVSGPIANDKVADVVDLYCKGKISSDEAIKRMKALPNVLQISLHTEHALTYLESVTFSQYTSKRWSNWLST